MQSAPLQKNISTATNNSTPSNSPKGGVSLPAVPVYQQKPIQKMELEEEQPVQAKLTTQLKVDITAAPPPSENSDNNNDGTTQLKELEEEMPLQGKFIVQKKELEDEMPMQGKFIAQRMELEEEQPIQGKFIIQRKEREEQVPIQPKFKIPSSAPIESKPFQRFVLLKSNEPEAVQGPIQRFVLPSQPIQKKENNTGLPDNLKAGVENLSGFSMDDVKVHYNSAKPAQLQAHAYAQGTDIHIGPGQEQHLPHEAWHVVQQKQGRVKATMQMKGGVNVNADKGLECEADAIGEKAIRSSSQKGSQLLQNNKFNSIRLIQRKIDLVPDVKSEEVKINSIYDAIKDLFTNQNSAEEKIKEKIKKLLDASGNNGEYNLANQAHKELLYYQVNHLLEGKELGSGMEAFKEKGLCDESSDLGTKANAYQIIFLGGGASIAYYVTTLDKSFNFSKAAFVYKEQPWHSERGPGVVAHPEHMISPNRTNIGDSMGDKRHGKMDKWMKRDEFSTQIEGVVEKAESQGVHLVNKVKKVSKNKSLYEITLDNSEVIYGHRVVSGLGAGGHIIPKGLSQNDLHHTSEVEEDTVLDKLIMNMDVFTQIAGHLKKNGEDIVQSKSVVLPKDRGDITLVLSGGNAALDVAYDALAKGYKVNWITGSRGATFLPGFLNQAAALPHDKMANTAMSQERQEALKKEILLLYKDQHLLENGVSDTDKLQKVIKGRATTIKQEKKQVLADVEVGKEKKKVTGDMLVFAIGPDLSTQEIFSKDIQKSLRPLADKNRRFTDNAADTHLAVGTRDRSLQIVGGAAFRFEPFKDRVKVRKLAQQSELLKNLHGDKKRKRPKEVFNKLKADIDPDDLKKLSFTGAYSLKDAKKLAGKDSTMTKVPDSLPGNVLISDQLTAILTQTEALNEFVPHDANLNANFLIDDRTLLRIHLSSKMPDLKLAKVGDEVVRMIVKYRSDKVIDPDVEKLPAAVPPYQQRFQKAWEQTIAQAQNDWTVGKFEKTFLIWYKGFVNLVKSPIPVFLNLDKVAKLARQSELLKNLHGEKKRKTPKAAFNKARGNIDPEDLKKISFSGTYTLKDADKILLQII